MASRPAVDTMGLDSIAVTPSDTAVFNPPLSGIFVGGVGNLAIKNNQGQVITFTAVAAGTTIPAGAVSVMATNTTATLIVGLR